MDSLSLQERYRAITALSLLLDGSLPEPELLAGLGKLFAKELMHPIGQSEPEIADLERLFGKEPASH